MQRGYVLVFSFEVFFCEATGLLWSAFKWVYAGQRQLGT